MTEVTVAAIQATSNGNPIRTMRSHDRLRPSTLTIASALLMTAGLPGCGGGGGGVAFIPAPPTTPPTAPPVTPSPMGTISAPARATAAVGSAPVSASSGGANFASGPTSGTVFPLLQTTLVIDQNSMAADAAASAAGGTAAVENGKLSIDTRHTHPGLSGTHGFIGEPSLSGADNLDWTRVGVWGTGGPWDYFESPLRHRGAFVAGYETPAAGLPTSGTARYTGTVGGSVYVPAPGGFDEASLVGDASFTADFGLRSVAGALTGMKAGGSAAWNDVTFTSAIAGNGFSGNTAVTTAPTGSWSLAGNATGTIEGKFFGPAAQEAGAVWTLFDGTKAAIGTLSGKRP